MRLDIKTLKVGDAVGYGNTYDHNCGIGIVDKISPSGQITVARGGKPVIKFNKNGNQIGEKFADLTLYSAESVRERFAERDRRQKSRAAVTAIQDWFSDRRGYSGEVYFNTAQFAELRGLVDALEPFATVPEPETVETPAAAE